MNKSEIFKIKTRYKIYFAITFPLLIAATLFFVAKYPRLPGATSSYSKKYNGAFYVRSISYMTDSSVYSYVILKGKLNDLILIESIEKNSVSYQIHPYGQKFKVNTPNTLTLVTKDKIIKKHIDDLKSQIKKYQDNKFAEKLFKNLSTGN